MKALVVGYGSIGSRHLSVLAELGCRVAAVSSRDLPEVLRFAGIAEALQQFEPDYVVIATETAQHHAGVCALADAGFSGIVLVEKPLFHEVKELPPHSFRAGFVAYNLRFHPLVQRLRLLLENESIVSAQAYVGQYLPGWRPQRDYRAGYSADGSAGGGVLRDISHELDYLTWILGDWQRLTALGGHFSNLEITSDDVFAVMMCTDRCPVVTVQLNYLDRLSRRQLVVNTTRRTIALDFIAGQLCLDDAREEFNVDRDYTYREMHRSVLDGSYHTLCSFAQGADVVRMIAAAEAAVAQRSWIWR